jgi:hypothetical protein
LVAEIRKAFIARNVFQPFSSGFVRGVFSSSWMAASIRNSEKLADDEVRAMHGQLVNVLKSDNRAIFPEAYCSISVLADVKITRLADGN